MKVGLDVYSIREMELTPMQQLDYAKSRGFEGVQFEELRSLSPSLDRRELAALQARAAELGLYTHVSVSAVNPNLFTLSREALLARLGEEIEAASALGWREVRSHMGILKNRLESQKPWAEHLEDSISVLRELRPLLRQSGVRLNLESHSDSTTFELLRVIRRIGPDYVGITLDTGNLLTHGEYPVEAVRRLAPYAHLTHAKDAYLFFSPKGFIRQGCPPGRGVVEWEKVVSILAEYNPEINLSIEDHKKLFEINFGDPAWLAWHPDIPTYELGQLMRLAFAIEEKRRAGLVADMLEYEAVPYLEQVEDRLPSGCQYLKALLDTMGLHGH